MKKLVGGLIIITLVASVHAGLDIQFSSDNNGYWAYTAIGSGTGDFSFYQTVRVDNVQGTGGTALDNKFVHISPLQISLNSTPIPGTEIYIGSILNSIPIEIKNGSENMPESGKSIFKGELSSGGSIYVIGATVSFCPDITEDITDIDWDSWDGPASMDFSLTLQGSTDIASMILSGKSNPMGGSFSGNMSIPEPATLVILCCGSLMLFKDKFSFSLISG